MWSSVGIWGLEGPPAGPEGPLTPCGRSRVITRTGSESFSSAAPGTLNALRRGLATLALDPDPWVPDPWSVPQTDWRDLPWSIREAFQREQREQDRLEALQTFAGAELQVWDRARGWAHGADTLKGQIERRTRSYRDARARMHIERGRAIKQQIRELLQRDRSEAAMEEAELLQGSARWHYGRARGLVERFWEVENCGRGTVRVKCPQCGKVHEVKLRCGDVVSCPVCREKRARKQRARFLRAFAEFKDATKNLRLAERGWAERTWTLTIPQRQVHGAYERTDTLFLAAEHFGHLFRRWLRKQRRNFHIPRSLPIPHQKWFECEPGFDGDGHPHWHVWAFIPGLDSNLVLRWWASALIWAGVLTGEDEIISPMVKTVRSHEQREDAIKGKLAVRLVEPNGSFVSYLEGWSISETTKNGKRMEPETQAAVWTALEGRRLNQAARGFLKMAERKRACPVCRATAAPLVVIGHWRSLDPAPTRETLIAAERAAVWNRKNGIGKRAGPIRTDGLAKAKGVNRERLSGEVAAG